MLARLGDGATMTVAILSLLTFVIVLAWVLTRRRRQSPRERGAIPLFAVPARAAGDIARPTALSPVRDGLDDSLDTPTPARVNTAFAREPGVGRFAPTGAQIRTRDGAVSTLPLPPRDDPVRVEGGAELIVMPPIAHRRPADGTLQFLPGRLEVVSGRGMGEEIRFVRTPGPDGTTVTFGRAEGAAYRHVQLGEPTVSRTHARMTLDIGDPLPGAGSPGAPPTGAAQWRLDNLSATNPVIVNGRPLHAGGSPGSSVILTDGDRIEMGEVAFIYHAR